MQISNSWTPVGLYTAQCKVTPPSDRRHHQTATAVRPPLSSDHHNRHITTAIRPPSPSDHHHRQTATTVLLLVVAFVVCRCVHCVLAGVAVAAAPLPHAVATPAVTGNTPAPRLLRSMAATSRRETDRPLEIRCRGPTRWLAGLPPLGR